MAVSIRRVLSHWAGSLAAALKRLESRWRPGGKPESDSRRLYDESPVMRAISRNESGTAIVTSCNALFAHTLGYEVGEVIGRPITDFYSSRSVADFKSGGFQRALEGVFQAEERWLLTRAGAEIHTLLRARPMKDSSGKVTGTDGVFIDITDRDKAVQELRRSEVRYRILLENVDQVIYMLSGDDPFQSRVELVSERVSTVFGYSPREFREDPELWFANVHPDDVAQLAESTQRIVTSGKPGVRAYRFRHKLMGEWLWVEDNV
ncbi:MAG: PAS domain-containing protein, partial [Acidobacteria bacterium]|nr:PAS domain-containing protein [Acidobacteriota bacterium]